MKLTPPLRLIVGVLLVTLAASLAWWLVGYQIGKGAISGPMDLGTFKKVYGFDPSPVVRIAFFALVGAVAMMGEVSAKWLALAGVAFGAAVINPDHGTGGTVGMILFVLSAAGVAALQGTARQWILAGVCSLLVGFAFASDLPVSLGNTFLIALLRGLACFLPLLALPPLFEKQVLRRLGV